MPTSVAVGARSGSAVSSRRQIRRRLALLFAFLTATLWGTAYVAAKYALQTLPPFTAAAARFMLAVAVLWPLLLAMRRVEKLERRDLPLLIAASLFQATLYFALQYAGMQHTTAANTALIVNTRPIFVAILSALWLHEALRGRQVMGILLAFAGVVVIIWSGTEGWRGFSRGRIFGDVLILLNAFSGALAIILLKKMVDRYSPLVTAVYTTTVGTIGLIPLAVWEVARMGWPTGSPVSWAAVVYMALANTAIPYLLWYTALSRLKEWEAAVFLYLTPVISVMLSARLLSERMGVWFVFGGVMVLFGAYQTIGASGLQRRVLPTAWSDRHQDT
ncbi:MAG: DMT family transporter [Anaerolineales bacterium]|nr:MAG: DMT family transporter [Anaerolineales bacterium]